VKLSKCSVACAAVGSGGDTGVGVTVDGEQRTKILFYPYFVMQGVLVYKQI
jgi:hypothetical protein